MNVGAIISKLDDVLRVVKDVERTVNRILKKAADGSVPPAAHGDSHAIAEDYGQVAQASSNVAREDLHSKPVSPARYKTILDSVTLLVAVIVAFFYWRQLNVMEKTMRLDERPWVKVGIEAPRISPGTPLFAKTSIVNVGKTPAREAVYRMMIEIVPANATPMSTLTSNVAYQYRTITGIMYPNDPFPVEIPGVDSKTGNPIRLSQSDIASLGAGDTYIAVYGTVEYVDTLRNKHWTHICSWFPYSAGKRFKTATCTAYNDADQDVTSETFTFKWPWHTN